jgi:HK97 family phage major capsid protein
MKDKFTLFLEKKGITQEAFALKTADELATLYNEHNKIQGEELDALIESKADKSEIELMLKDFRASQLDQMNNLNTLLKEMGLAITANTEGKGTDVKGNSIKEALKSNLEGIKSLENNRDANWVKMTVKAVGTMLESANVSGGNVPVEQRIQGLNTIASRKIRLMDLVSRGTATSNLISWVYQSGKEGAAGGTAEGAVKNQIDFNLVVASEVVVKRTAFIKVSTEMLTDIDFIESEINNELIRELNKDVELTAYSGNGTAPNMNGVRTVATTFAAGDFALAIDNANQADVLVVAINQIAIAEQPEPTAILMHPTDVAKLMVVKVSSTDRRYVDRLQLIAGQLSLDGVPIIKTTLVTAGTYLVGAFNLATLYSLGTLSIEMGLSGDDFTRNLRTIIAEFRGAMVVKNNDRTAFVKGTFATDMAALETV